MSGIGELVRGVFERLSGGGGDCSHLDQALNVEPQSSGCEECLAASMRWVHLRFCLTCGHVGCCNSSEGKHAFAHFEETGHAIARSHEPGETWSWCWIDEIEV